jgi:hypothetical protein
MVIPSVISGSLAGVKYTLLDNLSVGTSENTNEIC